MVFEFNGTSSEYLVSEAAGDAVLFLHGWGGGLCSFAGAFRQVSDWGMNCVNFAFPKLVPADWGIYDYAALVGEFLKRGGIKRPIVVGHSFGGRVATVLAAQGVCGKLVLVDAAGMKPKFSLRKKMRIAAYKRAVKAGKPLDGFGSMDYNTVVPEMRPVFVRVVNTHLEKLLPFVKCDTLVFWGRADKETPLYMAKRLHRGIQNSRLTVVDGGHYSYIDCPFAFFRELKTFITE